MKIDDVRRLAKEEGLSEAAIEHAVKRIKVDENGDVINPELVIESLNVAAIFKTTCKKAGE